uniref:Uncharacterized protein n=1 Tax=Biomphalaria glabrata TaxID=6526 RepID=A0A2C9LFU5_BIOGL
MVSALKGVGAKMDKEISEGLTWLLNEIKKSWETLSPKVQEDMAAQALAQEKEREERKARVKKQREEREKAEELERTARGLPKKAESDEEDFVDGNPFKALDLAQLEKKERMLKAEKHSKDKKLNVLDRGDGLRKSMGDPIIRRRSLDSSNTKRSLDDLDIIRSTNHSPEKLKAGPKMGLTSYDLEDSRATRGGNNSEVKLAALSLFGRNTRGQALPPLSQLPPESSDKKFRKKKKRLTDYNLPANSDDDTNNKENSSWNSGLFRHEPGLFSRESEVHELTPRMTKPKISKIVNTSKIDEEEESYSNQDTYYSRKLGRNSDFSRNHLTIKSSQFDSKLGKENSQKGYETFPRDLDREDSMYRRTLKHISPPSLKRFDEEKEGESSTERDDLEEVSDDNGDRFVSYQNRRNLNLAKQTKSNQIKSKKKLISREMDDDDDDEEADGGYSQSSILKDTLRFPRSPRYDDDASSRDNDESPRDLHKEIRDVQQLYSSGLLNGHSSSQVKRGLSETPTKKSSDTKNKDDKFGKVDQSNRPETRRKKKRSIFRSNKLAPSDDDADSTVSDRLGSPRLVQQATKHDSLARLGNARSTQFHNNVPKEQDFSAKWGLAEELPVIEDDYTVRRIPNFDDSDADDIVF